MIAPRAIAVVTPYTSAQPLVAFLMLLFKWIDLLIHQLT
jgi:hypothetical protein